MYSLHAEKKNLLFRMEIKKNFQPKKKPEVLQSSNKKFTY